MPEFKSRITRLAEKMDDLNFKDIIEDIIFDEIAVYEEEKVLEQGVFSSVDEYGAYQYVASELAHLDQLFDQFRPKTKRAFDRIASDPRTAWVKQILVVHDKVWNAKNLQELDAALEPYRDILEQKITMKPGELEMRIARRGAELSERSRALADELRQIYESKSSGESLEDRRALNDILETITGSKGSRKGNTLAEITPIKPTKIK